MELKDLNLNEWEEIEYPEYMDIWHSIKERLCINLNGTLTYFKKKESSGEFLQRIGTNGDLWAKEFIKIFQEKRLKLDVDLMRGWFCNAIEAGRNAK